MESKPPGRPTSPYQALNDVKHLRAMTARDARIIFGHWSVISGFVQRNGVVGPGLRLQVWGGSPLTAFDLDVGDRATSTVGCRRRYRSYRTI